MSVAAKRWAKLSGAEKVEQVRLLLAADVAPSTIAFKLGASPAEIARIATFIRREAWAKNEPVSEAVAVPPPVPDEPPMREPVAFDPSAPKPDWTRLTPEQKPAAIMPYLVEGRSNGQIAALFRNCGINQIAGTVNRMKRAGMNPPSREQNQRRGNLARATAQPKPPREPRPRLEPKPKAKLLTKTAAGVVAKPMRSEKSPHYTDCKARAAMRAAAPEIVIRREDAFEPIPGTTPVPYGTQRACRWPVDGLAGKGLLWCGLSREPDCSWCSSHRALSYAAPTQRTRQLEKEPA